MFINCYWCDHTVHKAGDLNLHFFHSLKSEWLPTIFFQKVLPVCVKDRQKKSLFEGKKKVFWELFVSFCHELQLWLLCLLSLFLSHFLTQKHILSHHQNTHIHSHPHTQTHIKSSSEHTKWKWEEKIMMDKVSK